MTLDVVTIALALTSLFVTVIGFFASVRFYRDGVHLQQKAADALGRIEEKAAFMQEHFGGVLDKTLDAVFGQLSPGAQRDQQLQIGVDDPSDSASGGTGDSATHGPGDNADKLFRYYALMGLQLSDVSEGIARGLFSLGNPYGFNLFNHGNRFLYTGYFPLLSEREVKARIVLLYSVFKRTEDSIGQLDDGERIEVQQVLEQLTVHVIIANTVETTGISDVVHNLRIAKMRPTLTVNRMAEISELLDGQLNQIGV